MQNGVSSNSPLPPAGQRLFETAVAMHRQGRLAEAERLYRSVLQMSSSHATTLHGLGIICTQTDRLADAAETFERALAIAPENAGLHGDFGNVLFRLGRYPEAQAHYEKMITLEPGSAEAYANLGNTLKFLNHADKALAALAKAMALNPRMPEPYINTGSVHLAAGRDEQALYWYEKALAVRPNFSLALEGIGNSLNALGRPTEALVVFERLLALDSKSASAYLGAGKSLEQQGRTEEALDALTKAIALNPQLPEPYVNAGSVNLAASRFKKALYWYERALTVRSDVPLALEGLGNSLNALGRPTEALTAFQKILALDPNSASAHLGTGNSLEQLGRLKEARHAFERAVALAPRLPTLHYALAKTGRFAESDPRLVALEKLAQETNSFSEPEQVYLHFALAKAYDDLKRHEPAFAHLQKGNAIMRRLVNYDIAKEIGYLQDIAVHFASQLMQAKGGAGHPSEAPVFIVGMPRSGTSLVEQILASHPDVFGAGELNDLADIFESRPASGRSSFDADLLTGEWLREIGSRYVTQVRTLAPEAKRIIDKMPGNIRFAGLIHLALPNARIIHVRRDALDTCFSCYSTLFKGSLNFSYDLSELGRVYKAYEELMAHWHTVLPEGVMLDVQYEDIVEDFEPQARRLVAFCGLSWDERCLKFHESAHAVRTASATQVRQPLFKSSIGRWRPYAEWLGPLRDALGY